MKTAERIRAALKDGPLARADLAAILNLTRQQLASHLDKQLCRGLLANVEGGAVKLMRPSLRENTAERARRARIRRDKSNARKRARRAAYRALHPARVPYTPEEREAARKACAQRRDRDREARGTTRPPPLTDEQRRERNRVRQREWYARNSERIGRKRRKPPQPKPLKVAKAKPPGLTDCAKSKPEPVKLALPTTADLSLDQLRAMGVKCDELPPAGLYVRPRLLPMNGRWIGTRAA